MKKLNNIHPGEILLEEFLLPMQISQYKLSKDLNIPQTRVSQIVGKTRRITADTALRLSIYFGTSAKFWLGLQDDYDIEEEQKLKQKKLQIIQPYQVIVLGKDVIFKVDKSYKKLNLKRVDKKTYALNEQSLKRIK